MIQPTIHNGHPVQQTTPQPSPYTKAEIAESHLRVWIREMLRERGLREVLKIVQEEFGYPLEIRYKV